MAWYDAPVTQSFGQNGEQGIDLGTQFHTPLTDLLPGVVKRILCDVGWACEIDIAATYQGKPVTESYLHVDVPEVQVGQQVTFGSEVGLSGGQLAGGAHPDSPQYSSGPHVEFDIFQGGAWQNPTNPASFIDAVRSQGAAAAGGDGSVVTLGTGPGGLPTPGDVAGALGKLPGDLAASVTQGIVAGAVGAFEGVTTAVGHGIANAGALAIHDVAVWGRRQFVALLVATVFVLVLFL